MQEFVNRGALEGRRATDFVAGVLPYEVRLPSGDWEPYAPPGEKQHSSNLWDGDSMACVSFSAINSIETQEYFLTGRRVNYSDRWIAKMSGTTINGNYLYKVADAIRMYGLVLESDYPAPSGDKWSFTEYHKDIPEPLLSELRVKGQEWLKTHKVDYEWVDILFTDMIESLRKQLKQAPVQVVIPGHAIEEIRNQQDIMRFMDSYDPFLKNRPQRDITSALKILLTMKGITMAKVLNDNGTIRIEFGAGEKGFNIGVASSSLFNQIVASGEPILQQTATTPEKMTLSEGMILHGK